LYVGLLAVVLAAAGSGAWYVWLRSSPAPTAAVQRAGKPAAKNTAATIRFIATGDMLPHDSVNQNAKTADGSYDYLPFFAPVKPYLTSADMSFCNQESPSNPNAPVSGYPTFNAPASFAQDLSQLGCNVINLANNHADDKGQAGIDATRQVWAGLKTLAVAGTSSSPEQQSQVAYFTVKSVKFAFLSYAQCSNDQSVSSYGLNIFSQSLAGQQIAEAKTKADMIIAAMHSCDENRSTEDTWQDQTAQYFADQGVNIVIGTGPHWLQPAQRLPRAGGGTTVVWYSLGNFLGTQLDVNGLIGGIAVMDIDVVSKTVTKLSFLPTYMHYEWTAAQKAADDEAARHNLMIYPLDQAAAPLTRSQNDTTVEAQTSRVTQLMNSLTPVTMLTSQTFPK
jgi:poly-gamma-glutamate synthesis protein (capsule biosynthesis protein)